MSESTRKFLDQFKLSGVTFDQSEVPAGIALSYQMECSCVDGSDGCSGQCGSDGC